MQTDRENIPPNDATPSDGKQGRSRFRRQRQENRDDQVHFCRFGDNICLYKYFFCTTLAQSDAGSVASRSRSDAPVPSKSPAAAAASQSAGNWTKIDSENTYGPKSCLPCSAWNLLCGMGFKITNYAPRYQVHGDPGVRIATLNEYWMTITIGGLSQLGGDLSRAVAPYVRVHVLNMHSGEYIMSLPVHPQESNRDAPQSIESYPVAPMNSRPCALRTHDASVHWNETFVVRARFSDVTNPNTIMLFELLDNPPEIRKNGGGGGGGGVGQWSSGGSRVEPWSACLAWGFLLPRGTRAGAFNFALPPHCRARRDAVVAATGEIARKGAIKASAADTHIEERAPLVSTANEEKQREDEGDGQSEFLPLRLQLYQYRGESWLIEGIQRRMLRWPSKPFDHTRTARNVSLNSGSSSGAAASRRRVPEVYIQWRRQRHVKAQGVLNVAMSYVSRAPDSAAGEMSSTRGAASDAAIMPTGTGGENSADDSKKSLAREEAERAAMRSIVARRSRSALEPTVIPNRLIHRLSAGVQDGCSAVRYSHSGVLLAVGSISLKQDRSVAASFGGGGSRYPGVVYSVSIFDSDTADLLWCDEYAHYGVVYDIKWLSDDSKLVTCSADGRCRIYDVKLTSRGFREFKEGALEHQLRAGDSSRNSVSAQAASISGGAAAASAGVSSGTSGGGGLSASVYISRSALIETTPPVFIYCVLFQEPATRKKSSNTAKTDNGAAASDQTVNSDAPAVASHQPPQTAADTMIITGAADGRLRVYDVDGAWQGELLSYDPAASAAAASAEDSPFSPHEKAVHDIVIDSKSRYLYSGDAAGCILMWRLDNRGWYQLIRRLKKEDISGMNVRSLAVYTTPVPPNAGSSSAAFAQTRSYLLVMATASDQMNTGGADGGGDQANEGNVEVNLRAKARQVLQLYDLSSYRVIVNYSGFTPPAAFTRASFSKDGRYVSTCCSQQFEGDSATRYVIKIWDTFTGIMSRCKLSELRWVHPVRAVAFHPRQHVLAVATVGAMACLCIFASDKASAVLTAAALLEGELQTTTQGAASLLLPAETQVGGTTLQMIKPRAPLPPVKAPITSLSGSQVDGSATTTPARGGRPVSPVPAAPKGGGGSSTPKRSSSPKPMVGGTLSRTPSFSRPSIGTSGNSATAALAMQALNREEEETKEEKMKRIRGILDRVKSKR